MPYWMTYVAIPFMAAGMGYLANRVVVELTFRPVTRRLGWQGVLASNTIRIAAATAELVTSRLVDATELLARIDPDRLVTEVEQPLLRAIDNIARDVLAEHHAQMWESLPPLAQDLVVKQLQAKHRLLIKQLCADLNTEASTVVDLKRLIVDHLQAEPARVVGIIGNLLSTDLAVFTRVGMLTGFGIGIAATGVLALTTQPLTLIVFALAIGVLAPVAAYRRALRHGLAQRGAELVGQLGEIMETEIITVQNLTHALMRGPREDTVAAALRRMVDTAVASEGMLLRPLRATAAGRRRTERMKAAAAAAATQQLPVLARHAQGYLTDTMAVARTISDRATALPTVECDRLLGAAIGSRRPALLAVSGALCGAIGWLQVLVLG